MMENEIIEKRGKNRAKCDIKEVTDGSKYEEHREQDVRWKCRMVVKDGRIDIRVSVWSNQWVDMWE